MLKPLDIQRKNTSFIWWLLICCPPGVKIFNVTGNAATGVAAISNLKQYTLSYTGADVYNNWTQSFIDRSDTTSSVYGLWSKDSSCLRLYCGYGYRINIFYKIPTIPGIITNVTIKLASWDDYYYQVSYNNSVTAVLSTSNEIYPQYTITVSGNYYNSSTSFPMNNSSYNTGAGPFCLVNSINTSNNTCTLLKNGSYSSINPSYLYCNLVGPWDGGETILGSIDIMYLA